MTLTIYPSISIAQRPTNDVKLKLLIFSLVEKCPSFFFYYCRQYDSKSDKNWPNYFQIEKIFSTKLKKYCQT